MVGVVKAKDAQVLHIVHSAVVLSVLQDCNCESGLIGLSGSAVVQVDLGHACWGHWHHVVSKQVGEVVTGEGGSVHSVSDKSIVQLSVSSLKEISLAIY